MWKTVVHTAKSVRVMYSLRICHWLHQEGIKSVGQRATAKVFDTCNIMAKNGKSCWAK